MLKFISFLLYMICFNLTEEMICEVNQEDLNKYIDVQKSVHKRLVFLGHNNILVYIYTI